MQALVSAIHDFTQAIVNAYDLDELLHRLTSHAASALSAEGAGIMLADADGRLRFAAATSQRITEVERIQDDVQRGVCVDAFRSGQLQAVGDLRTTERRSSFVDEAEIQQLRAVIGAPLTAHGQVIGVLNVYREAPGDWSAEQVEAAGILAAMGAGYILHANRLTASHRLSDQLAEALLSRATIEQAKGILMERHRLSGDEAFGRLRQASMDANRKLREVALEVLQEHGAATGATQDGHGLATTTHPR